MNQPKRTPFRIQLNFYNGNLSKYNKLEQKEIELEKS